MFSRKEKKYLLSLARRAIKHYLESGRVLEIGAEDPPPKLKEKKACFITLTIEGNLRGCIGHILPRQELYRDVIENAVFAAFQDPRFYPLDREEFSKIKIEISILTVPTPLEFASSSDILSGLEPEKDGVILKRGVYQATFLPQVWEELPQKEVFLGHLCRKAGLEADCWKASDIKVERYQVEAFGE